MRTSSIAHNVARLVQSLSAFLKATSVITIVTLATPGCGSDGGSSSAATPRSQDETQQPQQLTQQVTIEKGQMTSPLETQFGDLPAECNNIQFIHFKPALDVDKQPYQRLSQDADTLFFFMPGLLAGAGAFNYLAEQLILEAYQQQQAIEVLVLDRRDQCFRDTTGLEEAETERDITLAIDYYYNNKKSIDGRQFEGIKSGKDLPWLANMGLGLVQQDLMTVIQTLVPDPVQRQQKVFVGGHSLGGLLTHTFAGWDFDGDITTTEDAGYNQVAGFIRLDIDVTPKDETLDTHLNYGKDGFTVNPNDSANQAYQQALAKLVSGKSTRTMELPGLNTETFFLIEMAAMVAHWAPDAEASLINSLPVGSTTNLMLRLIHSRSFTNFVTNKPGIRDFRYTNEAVLGAIFDDDFMPVGILQTSLGFLGGGEVVKKDFPVNPVLSAIVNFLVPDLGNLLTKEQLYIAAESTLDDDDPVSAPLYRWINFDAIDNQVNTNTTEEEEVTDIALFAETIYKGPGTFTEWYMSARVGLELDATAQSVPIAGLPYWHANAARSKPLLEIVGGKGLPNVDEDMEPLGTLLTAAGYNHMDLLTASNAHKERRENEVIGPILEFARQNQPPQNR